MPHPNFRFYRHVNGYPARAEQNIRISFKQKERKAHSAVMDTWETVDVVFPELAIMPEHHNNLHVVPTRKPEALPVVTSAVRNLARAFLDQGEDVEVGIKLLLHLANRARREGIVRLDSELNHFFEKP